MTTPILYLDCDGVVSPWFRGYVPDDSPFDDWKLVDVPSDGFKSWFSKALWERILGLGYDVRWLSMRGAGANRLLMHFDYEPIPVACDPAREHCSTGHVMTGRGHGRPAWFKAEHVIAVAKHPSHPPFAWIDDELREQSPSFEARLWGTEGYPPSIPLSPKTEVGLTEHHFRNLRHFKEDFS